LIQIKEHFKDEKYLYDGNCAYKVDEIETLVKADAKVKGVGAASILAKVMKDYLLDELAEEFPNYNWKNNNGYVTKDHIEAIKKYGRCIHHRHSFKLKALGEKK